MRSCLLLPTRTTHKALGTTQGGLLPTVGTLKLEDSESETVTFAQLRPRIELQTDNFMIRFVLVVCVGTITASNCE